MRTKEFYHSLKVDKDLCYGCTHCLQSCPTKAIRIVKGKALIMEDRCIDCGECMRACPVHAIYVEQDDFSQIFEYKNRIAIVPAVFIGQFSLKKSYQEIIDAIKETGFTDVYLAEDSVEIINDIMLQEYGSGREKPLISTFCPAIVRLIQIKFPALVENIIPVKNPADVTAQYFMNQINKDEIELNKTGVFYVTPCPAKIADLKVQNSNKETLITGVINMNTLYNKVYHILEVKNKSKNTKPKAMQNYLSAKILQWSLTGGEAENMKGRCLAIDEVHNVIKFLEKVEDGEISNVKFLELRACDHGCAGGVLMTENRFITVERIKHRASKLPKSVNKNINTKEYKNLCKNITNINIEARPVDRLDDDMEQAFLKMKKIRHLMCYLPGIDCGACGVPDCQTLAKDVVAKKAHLSNCVFIQRGMEKNYKLSPEHSIKIIEKIWGEKRLEKNCNKKGAENETI